MAEIFLLSTLTEAVISHTIGRISDLLTNEAPSLSAVREDVEFLRNELRRIQSFLRQHQDMAAQDHRVRNWVSEIRDIAAEIEDVVDIYIVRTEFSYFKPFHLRSLQRSIKSIKAKLQSCFESRNNYAIPLAKVGGLDHVSAGASPSVAQLRRSYPDEDEDEEDGIVGLENTVKALKARLLEENDWLRAVPILGMGGLGKTTAAKRVYNDNDVKRRFDCRAWVLISQDYVARDVYAEILIQVGEGFVEETLNTMDENELIRLVKERLRGKRYLVVFDDVWRAEDFDSIRRIFPKDHRTAGSKVVFTTRMREVSDAVDPSGCPIQPPFLSPEESWDLLHRKAFPNDVFGERLCPPEFERMGKEMVKKCGGLPLAIVVLGGLLRTKNSEHEWRKVERDVNSHLNGYRSGVGQMLALSYHDLPYYLKPCFLYLGCFPEDWEIPRRQLIQLWIAEGLVIEPSASCRGQTLEEIAEQYLRELINRCMVQGDGVVVKTCRVHHLMRDFCVFKARNDNFSEVIRRHETVRNVAASKAARRIAVHPGCELHPQQVHPRLRSFMYFELSSPECLVHFCRSKNMRLLRVLEVGFNSCSSVRKCTVPTEIGNLIHLRYLGLRGGGRVRIPSSIENLRSLTTINLRDNIDVILPVEIFRLKRLKHLLLPSGTVFPYGFTWLTHSTSDTTQIQTLKYIGFGQFLLKGKMIGSEFKNLRNLGVEFRTQEEVGLFLAYPNFKLGSLSSLHMSLLSSVGFSGLKQLSQCVVLSKLILEGKLFNDGHALEYLPESLTKLILRGSGFRTDPMKALERLPNLRFLKLESAYVGSEMVCEAEKFQKLETLMLISMEGVTEWQVLGNAMSNLKRLYIKHMPNLTVPQALKSIKSLKDFIENE